MADPEDHYTLQALELALGKRVQPLVWVSAEIQNALQKLKGEDDESLADMAGEMDADANLDDIEQLIKLADSLQDPRERQAALSKLAATPILPQSENRVRISSSVTATAVPPGTHPNQA